MTRRANKKGGIPKIFDPSVRVFPFPTGFHDAFPELKDGWLDYRQTGPRGDFSIGADGEYHRHDSLTPIFPCDNTCRRGGFEMFWIVRAMIQDKQTEKEFRLKCLGFTGKLRPRNTTRHCENLMYCRVTLEYKTETEQLSSS